MTLRVAVGVPFVSPSGVLAGVIIGGALSALYPGFPWAWLWLATLGKISLGNGKFDI